jgi:hypothetical protein
VPKRALLLAMFLLTALSLPPRAARADVAPPMMPPGNNIAPGAETTQVRMVAETVKLAVSQDPADAKAAIARTLAIFTMRNLGASAEKMRVRFPLSFFNGGSDGFSDFPEIPSITVTVDGKGVPTRREMQPPLNGPSTYSQRDELPWATFEVTFPPAQDVTLQVTYTVRGYGYYPYETFDYVLETGAGWSGTIGKADIVVQLPYPTSDSNVLRSDCCQWTTSSAGGVINGNEIRWHYADLEPTHEDNIEVVLLAPSLWESVEKETANVTRNPGDGEAWGRLAKAYKEAARLPKGWLRDDPAGLQMLSLSEQAYQKCLHLLPRDPLWHYGYADLLWSEYYWGIRSSGKADTRGLLPAALSELQATLRLDANNSLAKDLLDEIGMSVDGAVQVEGNDYIYLALTATPLPPTPYLNPPTETSAAERVITRTPQLPASPTMSAPAASPTARNPLCGGAFLSLALPGAALIWMRRRSQPTNQR